MNYVDKFTYMYMYTQVVCTQTYQSEDLLIQALESFLFTFKAFLNLYITFM